MHANIAALSTAYLETMTSKLSRTRVTNGKALFLDGVDGRTLAARRYRDLFHSFVSDLGGMEVASEAQLQLARRCATMSCQAEVMEAEFIAGDDTDLERYLHLVGTLSRALSRLGIERKVLDVTDLSLEEYINGETQGGR
jgi:hypothetical protein